MFATRIILGKIGELPDHGEIGMLALMALMAAISLAILIGGPSCFEPRHAAYAAPMPGGTSRG